MRERDKDVPERLVGSDGAATPAAASSALTPERLCERAVLLARLDDFGDPSFREPLERLSASFHEAELSPSGQLIVGAHIVRALVTRLRLVSLRRSHPERFAARLREPLIVVGLPRSGTTFLYELLCALPGVRFLPAWEAREPIPEFQAEDQRRTYYRHFLGILQQMAPDLADKHPVDVDAPEECHYLLDPSLKSFAFSITAPAPSYASWLLRQDMREPYRVYRQLLGYVQAGAPEKRLILKSPAHLQTLEPLLEAVPEAKIIQVHRDPVAVVQSAASVFGSVYELSSRKIDPIELGTEMLKFLRLTLELNQVQRTRIPRRSVMDLLFSDLVRDPLGSARSIFDYFDLDWTHEIEQRARAYVARGAPDQVGRHQYSAEEFGLSAQKIAEQFASYRERWGFS